MRWGRDEFKFISYHLTTKNIDFVTVTEQTPSVTVARSLLGAILMMVADLSNGRYGVLRHGHKLYVGVEAVHTKEHGRYVVLEETITFGGDTVNEDENKDEQSWPELSSELTPPDNLRWRNNMKSRPPIPLVKTGQRCRLTSELNVLAQTYTLGRPRTLPTPPPPPTLPPGIRFSIFFSQGFSDRFSFRLIQEQLYFLWWTRLDSCHHPTTRPPEPVRLGIPAVANTATSLYISATNPTSHIIIKKEANCCSVRLFKSIVAFLFNE